MKVNGGGAPCSLVACAVVCLVATPGGGACPRRCACYVPAEVHCTFRYLTSIPERIPPDVQRINLGYNSLVRLTETDFLGLGKLQLLMLHSNSIHTIPARTFSDLGALQVLKMSYNKVQRLQKDTFAGLKSLTRLHMDHNTIEFIHPEVFHGLTALRLVQLEGNRLTKLHPDTFVSLRYLQIFKISFLKYLYLSDNFLSTLPEETVSCMPELESLYLHGNPWTCDCRLQWLAVWMQEKPDVIKCKKDRGASGAQQCPLCTNPRASTGQPLATVPAAAFLCVRPTIDPSLKRRHPTVLEDGGSVSVSPRDFMAPLGSLTLNLTDQSGNEANMACRIQRPWRTTFRAVAEDSDHISLNTSFSTFLVCHLDHSHIQPVWQILALYSDTPLVLDRSHLLTDRPPLGYRYQQVAPRREDLFTGVQVDLSADPAWVMQAHVALQLHRAATTRSTLHIQFSSDAQVTLPKSDPGPARHAWTMIARDRDAKLERTVVAGETLALDCPGHGDPAPRLEWLLADGSRVGAPRVSEDGRVLVDRSGKLELRGADGLHTGTYSCVSTNGADADILTYRVTVVEPGMEPLHENGAPHTVLAGETLDLPCRATGVPDASVSWVLPGNVVLSQSSADRQILNGTLRIFQVTPKDQGHYRCVAANPSGVDFLITHVSVKTEGPRPVEHQVGTEGSGSEDPDPTGHPEDPPAAQPPTTAPPGAEAGKHVLSTRQGHGYREVRHGRRGEPTTRRFREQRRQFPPSARRVDPRHWAALLEKAKRRTTPQGRANPTARPPPRVTRLRKGPSEEVDSSGMLPPDQGSVALAQVPSVQATTAPGSGRTPGGPVAGASPAVSPRLLPPGKPTGFKASAPVTTTENTSPAASSKLQDTPRHSPSAVPPPTPQTAPFQGAPDLGGRREHLQRVPPETAGVLTIEVDAARLGSAESKADLFFGPEKAAHGGQTAGPGDGEPRSYGLSAHAAGELSTARLPPGPRGADHAGSQGPGNSTPDPPLSSRLGRRRKVWGRRRIVSPYRTPALPRHRYVLLRPAARGSEQSTPGLSGCPSCTPTPGGATSPPPTPAPIILPEADLARATAADPTTLVPSRSLAPGDKPSADVERTTPTVKYVGAQSARVTPAGPVRTQAPTSVTVEKARRTHAAEAKQDSGSLPPPPGPTRGPLTPVAPATTRFSRGKIPWRQTFVDNQVPAEGPQGHCPLGSGGHEATVLPLAPPFPTDRVSPFPAAHSANAVTVPPVTLAATHPRATETHGPQSLPTGQTLPSPPLHPTPPSSSEAASTVQVTAATTAPPSAPASVTINKTQIARPQARKAGSERDPQSGRDPDSSPGPRPGFTPPPAATLPVPTRVEPAAVPSVSAFTHPPLEDARTSSAVDLYPRTLDRTDVSEGPSQEAPQTSKSRAAPERLPSSKAQQRPAARAAATRRPALPALGGLRATPMPTPTSPPGSNQSAVTNNLATPAPRLLASTEVKPQGPSRHEADPGHSAAGVVTSPKAHPSAKFTAGTTYIHSARLHSAPEPALVTAKPLSSTSTPLWSENQVWLKSYPESAPKDKEPGLSTLPRPEDTSQASNWDMQKPAEKGGFDKTPVQKLSISKRPPFAPLPRNRWERPRILGGRAASFTVPADSDASLPCVAVGTPLPTIHWSRVSPGVGLSAGKQDSRLQVFPNGTLSIRRVDVQDRGQYLCSAANPLGKDHLHVTLSVVSYPPRIVERHAREITVHSGSSVELPCGAEGRPRPSISWILANHTAVSESSEGNRQAQVTSDGTLVIRNLSVYDRGVYKCVASNSAGQDSRLVKVQVIAAPPVILEPRRQVVAGTWGASLTLPCTATGSPQPRVHWVLSDGTEVKPLQFIDSNVFLFSNGTLSLRHVAASDGGTYECIATSSTGSDRRVVTLTMEERETFPRIELASQTWNEVNFGDKLLLNCSASGEPKPKIMWRLPSRAVVDQWHRMGSRIHVYPNGSLFIGSVTEKDGGDYLCVARNKIGDDLSLMHVSLTLKPARIDRQQPVETQVLHGRAFQVDCKASGSPAPHVSWSLPDGTRVNRALHAADGGRRARRYTLFDNGTLYFNQVGVAEEGDYTCHAQNTLGKDEMKVHLTVVTAAPRIRPGLKANARVRAGDTAVLDCEVVGEPRPKVFWLLPSHETVAFSKDRYTFHANGSLSISHVQLLDSGEYVCVARNPSGDATRPYTLEVVSRPPLINGLYTNTTVIKATAVRHSKKHFDCRAEGTPAPQVTWIMPDNVLLTAPYHGGRVTVHENGTLEIRNVRLSDAAEFTCVARNEGGESVLVVRLQVSEMLRRPTFRSPFNEKVVAQLGQPTALSCSVDGNPPPEVIWVLPNGTQFPRGPHGPQHRLASNGSLMIPKATRDDAGKYRCGARNQVGYIEKLIVLEVGQKPVILTDALGTVHGISGDSLALHCVSDGSPKPHVKWTVPSGHTIDRPQVSGKYVLHENGTLVIKEATAYDRGNYVCRAQNSAGHAVIAVPVTVVAYPPRITSRPPRSVLTRTGAAVRLPCVALGVPKPEVTWERPGHSLLSVAGPGRTRGEGLPHPPGTLVIWSPRASDSGFYRCTARNALGSDSVTTYMQVI
ncbi:immunoglobulin superfamily member 10 [Molossus nigricans]